MPKIKITRKSTAATSLRFHLTNTLKAIVTMIEERSAITERDGILDIAAPREAWLLEQALDFLDCCDALQEEDEFTFKALEEARKIWPKQDD